MLCMRYYAKHPIYSWENSGCISRVVQDRGQNQDQREQEAAIAPAQGARSRSHATTYVEPASRPRCYSMCGAACNSKSSDDDDGCNAHTKEARAGEPASQPLMNQDRETGHPHSKVSPRGTEDPIRGACEVAAVASPLSRRRLPESLFSLRASQGHQRCR